MPDEASPRHRGRSRTFPPRVLRVPAGEWRLLEAKVDEVLAHHPAWPWPLVEAEARRRAGAAPAGAARPAPPRA